MPRDGGEGRALLPPVQRALVAQMLTEWTKGHRGPNDLALYEELCHAMKNASICGLGQVVHVPIASVMQHFPEEVEAHAASR